MEGTHPHRLVLLRSPRYVWPFNSETSAFWQPLGLLCAAAAVREHVPDCRVEVWDAPGERWGWATLARKLASERIDVLGIGEETCSAHEGLRAAAMVKQLHPHCLVVAGGVHFGHDIERTLDDGRVDVIVRGEAERTFPELLASIDDRDAWAAIAGLAFRDACGRTVVTPARRLIEDLDALPRPAYDLVDMHGYGRGSRNHPGLVSIEHSRGCVDSCSFCILWKHMGQSTNGNGHVRPCYRTKSPERSFEEVRWLHKEFGRRTFGWVDPTFNGSPAWSDGWAERMLASPLAARNNRPATLHTAWVRADGIIRDHQLGILDKLVRAGLRQVMIGLERDDAAGLAFIGKHDNDAEICREAIAILREFYPQVFTIGSVIFGLPGDTTDDLNRLVRWQDSLGVDYCFFIPLTPNPGTDVIPALAANGCLGDADRADFNFHTPVCRTRSLNRRELAGIYRRAMLRVSPGRLIRLARGLLHADARKRRVGRAMFGHGARIALAAMRRALTVRGTDQSVSSYSRKPSWYDS